VTISHLVSGAIESGFINVCLSSNGMEAFLHHSALTEEPAPEFFTMVCRKLWCAVSQTGGVILNLSTPCILLLLVFTSLENEGFTLVTAQQFGELFEHI